MLKCQPHFPFQFTALNSLKRWSEFNRSSITAPPAAVAYSSLTRQNSPFPYRDQINARFVLWEGDISLLNADGITNSTNENLNDINCITNRIFNRAGSALVDELKSFKGKIKINSARFHNFLCSSFSNPSACWNLRHERTFASNSLHYSYCLSQLQSEKSSRIHLVGEYIAIVLS